MKTFMIFLILILSIGCTATSTKQRQESGVESRESGVAHPSSPPLQGEESRGLDTGPKTGNLLPRGEEKLKLAEPASETLRRPWGGIWNVPAGLTPPKSNIGTENNASPQKSPASLPKIEEKTQLYEESQEKEGIVRHGESVRPNNGGHPPLIKSGGALGTTLPSARNDDVSFSSSPSPKRQPWGGIWNAPLKQSPPSVGEELLSQNVETTPPASWDDYKGVDFGKFTSGSYGSDYANKYVKIKCRFSRIGTEFVEISKYPTPDYVTFIVTGISSQLHSLSVVMLKSQADAVFKLKPQEEIILYGKAVQVDLHTLTMEVRKVER